MTIIAELFGVITCSPLPIYGKKHAKKFSQLKDPVRIVVTPCDGSAQNRNWLVQILESLSIDYAIPRNKRTWVWINSNDLVPLESEIGKVSSAYKPSIIDRGNPNY